MHELINLVPSDVSSDNMIKVWLSSHPDECEAYQTLQLWFPQSRVNFYCFSNLLTNNIHVLDIALFDYCLSQAFLSLRQCKDIEGEEIYGVFFSALTNIAANALTGVIISDPDNFTWSITNGQHFQHWLTLRKERWQWLKENKMNIDYQGSYQSVDRIQNIIASRILLPHKPSQTQRLIRKFQ